MMRCAILIVVGVLSGFPAWADGSQPDPVLTPGTLNPAVTQENIDQTICHPGWSQTIRPSTSYIRRLKLTTMRAYHYPLRDWKIYIMDHRVPLEVGGHPTDPLNLWTQPIIAPDGWNDALKNRLEDDLHRKVCLRQVTLAYAQSEFLQDWHRSYWRDVMGVP
jgi:hypothetical protein